MPRRTRCDIGTVLVHINALLTPKRVSGGWISLQLPSPPKASWKSVELQRATGEKKTHSREHRAKMLPRIFWSRQNSIHMNKHPQTASKKREQHCPTMIIQGSIKSSPCFLFRMIRLLFVSELCGALCLGIVLGTMRALHSAQNLRCEEFYRPSPECESTSTTPQFDTTKYGPKVERFKPKPTTLLIFRGRNGFLFTNI